MRKEDADESRLASRGRLREHGAGWNHRVEQGKGQGAAGAFQERPAWQVLLRNEHS